MNGQYYQTVGQWEYQEWLNDPVAQAEYQIYLDEKEKQDGLERQRREFRESTDRNPRS